jgi:hypothetical protein
MRTVVKEHEVSDFVDRETQSYPRLRDVIAGLEWLLSRKPDLDAAVPIPGSEARTGHQMYLLKTMNLDTYRAGPPLRLIYYYTDEEVVFWGIGFD